MSTNVLAVSDQVRQERKMAKESILMFGFDFDNKVFIGVCSSWLLTDIH